MWNLASQSALVAVLISVATVVAFFIKGTLAQHVHYAGFSISIALYYLVSLMASLFGASPILDNLEMMMGGLLVITTTIFLDTLTFEAGVLHPNRTHKTILSGLAVILVGSTPIAHHIAIKIAISVFAAVLIALRIKRVALKAQQVKSPVDKTRLHYFSIGGLLVLGTHWLSFSGFCVAFFIYFLYQALLASRLLDLHELLTKVTIFSTLAMTFSALYLLLASWTFGQPSLLFSNTLLASSLILILYEPLKQFLEPRITPLFFKEHPTFARDIQETSKLLTSFIDLPKAVDYVLNTLYDSKHATHISLYLLEPDGVNFSLQGHRGQKPIPLLDGKQHPVLFRHLIEDSKPILRCHIDQQLTKRHQREVAFFLQTSSLLGREAENISLLTSLDVLYCELLLPLNYHYRTIGFLSIKNERLSDAYTNDEIAALCALCDQFAITVENSHVFDEIKEKDRLAVLGEMSAGLAHEIRNPLAAIKGAAQTLDPDQIAVQDKELVQIIIDEVNRLNSVVTSFLNYAKPFRLQYTPVDLNPYILKTAQLMSLDLPKHITLETELCANLPLVNADAEQISQVLINLILNAKDALDLGGNIRIATRVLSQKHLKSRVFPEKPPQTIEIVVQDSGKGILPHLKDKIFIPFFTTKDKGSGLGLSLCQRIIQEHQGRIFVRSIVGKGTTFIVRIPVLNISNKGSLCQTPLTAS